MEKKKLMLRIISIVVLVSMIVLIQVFVKTNVLEQVSQSQERSDVPKALDVSSWDTSKVTVYTDKSGKKAPIPIGYVASQVTGETEIDTGLVIYEGEEPVTGTEIGVPGTSAWIASCNRNQWVWVPVPDVNRIYDKSTRLSKLYEITETGRKSYPSGDDWGNREPGIAYMDDNERNFSQNNLSGMTRRKLLYEIDDELVETIKSIEKYGGFYIGRYETGKVSKTGSINYVRPVIQRMQGDNSINYVSWYDAYMKLRTLGANESVKANNKNGCLWDETLQWFKDSGAKTDAEIYNSATWGNHSDSEGFTYYTNTSGSTGTKTQGFGTITPTGAAERNKANNIYDMAGNCNEYIFEGNYGRTWRGGDYYFRASDRSVGFRGTIGPYSSNSYYGVRAYFYIK